MRIYGLYEAGIITGCNPPVNDDDCPNDCVTRGQMGAFLVRALGYTDDVGGGHFIDTVGHTFEKASTGHAQVTMGCNPPQQSLLPHRLRNPRADGRLLKRAADRR